MSGEGRQFSFGPCLGKGGFGEVYLVSVIGTGGLTTEAAVKVLRSDLGPAEEAVRRLRDEGRLLARLNHPAILRVYDLLVLDGAATLLTEYVDGADLDPCLAGTDGLGAKGLFEVISMVASALDAAWNAKGVSGQPLRLVHRDIKPSNIRISRHGQIKLLDFGIARAESFEREARTQTNMMVGSPGYIAPERFLSADVLPQSDVFALGCCLFEGLRGERLFHRVSVPMMTGLALERARFETFLSGRLGTLAQSEQVRDLLTELLAYDPERRPVSTQVALRCEVLAEAAEGAAVARWARDRCWPEPKWVSGPWSGRTVSEFSNQVSPLPAEFREAPSLPSADPAEMTEEEIWPLRIVRQMGLGFGLLALVAGAAAGVVVLLIAGAVWVSWDQTSAVAGPSSPQMIPSEPSGPRAPVSPPDAPK